MVYILSDDGSMRRNVSPNSSFLLLITNICCVTDEINLLYDRKTQRDGSYQNYTFEFCMKLAEDELVKFDIS